MICSIGFCAVNAHGQPAVPQTVPMASDVEAARGMVREVFADKYKQAKTSQAKTALAGELTRRSCDPVESPVTRYVLLTEALELNVTNGDVISAYRVIDELAQSFSINPMTEKMGLLQKEARVASTPARHRFLAQVAMRLGNDAASKEDFGVAQECFKQAQSSVQSAQDERLQSRIGEQSRQVDEMFAESLAAIKGKETLAALPLDPESSLLYGRHRCLTHRDWQTGLPLLKQSSHPSLATVAARDLGGSDTVADQIAIANSWIAVAIDLKPRERPLAAERAIHWYERALPNAKGINKEFVEKRLEAAQDLASGRNFPEALSKLANGLVIEQVLDCSKEMHWFDVKPTFDLQASWLLSLQYKPSALDGDNHAVLLWGDSRAGKDPLGAHLYQDKFTIAVDDCHLHLRQQFITPALPSDVGQWIDVKFEYDAVAGDLELHLRHRLIQRQPLTIAPSADRPMPVTIGGADGHHQRFPGRVRNVWLGNLQ